MDTPAALDEVVAAASEADRYAVDTEFHRERTYWPRLALVQLDWGDGVALIDPTSVDVTPLRRLLEGSGTAVMHAAGQDLEVLDLACGAIPAHLFDTQIAAGFVGMSNPSLANLIERLLSVKIAKADRLTDWLKRPLGPEQIAYAASDVQYLLQLHDLLQAELAAQGRLQWALDECELFRTRPLPSRDPADAWLRIKEARMLRGRAAAVAQAVAAWREERAARIDQPVRYVMSDLALLSIAQRPPRDPAELAAVRGLDSRLARGATAASLMEAIGRGMRAPVPARGDTRTAMVDPQLRPAVTLVSAWISQLARDLSLDTALVATRADIEMLVAGDSASRLRSGWRAQLVGTAIERLVAGEVALAFDPGGKLVLEERSHRRIQ